MMIYVHSIKSHQLISNILDIMYIQLNHIEIDNPWYILISTILKHVLYIKSWYFHRVILCFWSGLHWQKGRGICGRSPEGGAICRFFLALKVKRRGKVKEMGQDVGYTHMFPSFFRSEVDQKNHDISPCCYGVLMMRGRDLSHNVFVRSQGMKIGIHPGSWSLDGRWTASPPLR